MLSKVCKIKLTCSILLFFLVSFTYPVHGTEEVALTLQEAIALAFQENPQLKLDRWENALLEREKELAEHLRPTISVSSTPFYIADGDIHSPSGNFTLSMPITDQTTLQSRLNVDFAEGTIKAQPSGELKFECRLFSPTISNVKSPLDPEIALENNLILSLTQLFINLRKSINNLAVEKMRLEFYQQSYEKASLAENSVEIDRAHQSITASEERIQNLNQSINEHNQELSYFLNQEPKQCNPIIGFTDYKLEEQPEVYMEKILAFDDQLLASQNALSDAKKELVATKKSLGWTITSSANLKWDPKLQDTISWTVDLNASKQLYPKEVVEERQELKVAQAELTLAKVERQVIDQAERLLQSIVDNQDRRAKVEKKIIKAKLDLDDIQRRYAAGLATELNLNEKQLNLMSLEIELEHLHYDYLSSLLQLFHKSGYQLIHFIPRLIAKEVPNFAIQR